MRTLNTKDIGATFRNTSTGSKLLLIGFPKRCDPKKADSGIFRIEGKQGSEITVGADYIEPWTANAEATRLGSKPCTDMTMRELMAAKILQGIVANPTLTTPTTKPKDLTHQATGLADALIKSLSS